MVDCSDESLYVNLLTTVICRIYQRHIRSAIYRIDRVANQVKRLFFDFGNQLKAVGLRNLVDQASKRRYIAPPSPSVQHLLGRREIYAQSPVRSGFTRHLNRDYRVLKLLEPKLSESLRDWLGND